MEARFIIENQKFAMTFMKGNLARCNKKYRDKVFAEIVQSRGSWEYNEIVGYIKLHFLGDQIMGEYYSSIFKMAVRSRVKVFNYKTYKLASEILIIDKNNENIYEVINEYIDSCKLLLTGRYIDDRLFRKIGPYINWKEII